MIVLLILIFAAPTGEFTKSFPAQGLTACAIGAQPTAAQWIADHPQLRLLGWRCAIGKREGAA